VAGKVRRNSLLRNNPLIRGYYGHCETFAGRKLRGQKAIPHSLDEVIRDTFRLWRKYHLGYDQTKYVVERVRRRLTLQSPHTRSRTVARLEQSEVQRLIQTTYRSRSKYGLMIKTLFQTGARVDEFVHIRVEDLLLDGDPPQIHIIHAKRGADRYVPILPALADELRTHLQGRQSGFLI
jgi:integrase/recombinase XerD